MFKDLKINEDENVEYETSEMEQHQNFEGNL